MATNNSVIKSLTANSYNGRFEASNGGFDIVGQFNTNGEKVISNISGSVKQGNAVVVSFNAYKNGDNYRYNFSDISDISVLSLAVSAITSVISSVEEELAE